MNYESNGNEIDVEIEHKVKHDKVLHFYLIIKNFAFKNGSFYYLMKTVLNDVLMYVNIKRKEYPGKFYSFPINIIYKKNPSNAVYDIIQHRFCF